MTQKIDHTPTHRIRRKYADCQRADGNCSACPLAAHWCDCHNRPISKVEWYRRAAGLTQEQLSEVSGVYARQIRRGELGEADPGNLTLKNALALADALGISARDLL